MDIEYLVVHCSATPPHMGIGVDEIRRWHLDRGWSDVGYHYVIRRDGRVEKGRADDVPGAHVRGYNRRSLGICMVGGVDKSNEPDANYTQSQWTSLSKLVNQLKLAHSSAQVLGHRDFEGVDKACPCFDVIAWFNEVN